MLFFRKNRSHDAKPLTVEQRQKAAAQRTKDLQKVEEEKPQNRRASSQNKERPAQRWLRNAARKS